MDFSISIASGPDFDFKAALELFFLLIMGHALADFPLQGDFLSRGKNRNLKPPQLADGNESPSRLWIYLMSAHSLIHAFFVWAFTGSVLLGLAEFIIHWIIDALKCEGRTSFETDQWLHIITKIVFVVLIWAGLVGGS
jgi:hypothetical protein